MIVGCETETLKYVPRKLLCCYCLAKDNRAAGKMAIFPVGI